jgi:hypothetical protein
VTKDYSFNATAGFPCTIMFLNDIHDKYQFKLQGSNIEAYRINLIFPYDYSDVGHVNKKKFTVTSDKNAMFLYVGSTDEMPEQAELSI